MEFEALIKELGYDRSPHFLRAGEGGLETAPAYGHIFRLASKTLGLRGVYTLKSPAGTASTPVVPLVYVCEAEEEKHADEIHRLVWNQDAVPFLIVHTRENVRLYSAFRYSGVGPGTTTGVLRVLRDTNSLLELTREFNADAIDDGAVWQKWGQEVKPEDRVDWRLLDNLRTLDGWLQKQGGLAPRFSHALIGKYVYLHYLKDRDILSERKLESWNISKEGVFGRDANLESVTRLLGHLDQWLNGSIFPIDFTAVEAPTEEHLRRVAATFQGDELQEDGKWQLHLDFKAYNFSYIPIETLSVVYEQFLHAPIGLNETTRGREAGAYYTPIPVVNFMIAEMADTRPLRRGMKVLDPSCGSGAFLVQCYRQLIEAEFPPASVQPTPIQLRELLQQSIFGVDRDGDACSVTELSLLITLLDYVKPPDLENDRRIKLPSLREQNIFHADYFADFTPWKSFSDRKRFDWIIGNPPWKKLVPEKLKEADKPAWSWIGRADDRGTPVGGNQVAQAFAWQVEDAVASDGIIGLLLPAMTLFEEPSKHFRKAFFNRFQVSSVANFSNLAEVLFAGRSRVPAASFFYCSRTEQNLPLDDEVISTYSPLVANQEMTRPVVARKRNEIWSLVFNASEVREIPTLDVITGSGRPWKLAAWGSQLDEQLLRRLGRRFPSLREAEHQGLFRCSEGLQLRSTEGTLVSEGEELVHIPDVRNRKTVDVTELKKLRHIFTFPERAVKTVADGFEYGRKGRAELALSICRPPHVIVSAARNFAIYSDEYLVVPARQVGIVSPSDDKNLLKALSLYLSSDFAYYHQFLSSSQFGVKRDVATLAALREIPIPITKLSQSELSPWADLHAKLVKATQKKFATAGNDLFSPQLEGAHESALLDELNELVASALGLKRRDRALIEDLVHVRLELNDGKLGQPAVAAPTGVHIKRYARRLKAELDGFIDGHLLKRHHVRVLHDGLSGMIEVDLTTDVDTARETSVLEANAEIANELEKTRKRLRKRWAQWVYFDRNLTIFQGSRTFIFKPMQRFHWTEGQAMVDAAEIIAGSLAKKGVAV